MQKYSRDSLLSIKISFWSYFESASLKVKMFSLFKPPSALSIPVPQSTSSLALKRVEPSMVVKPCDKLDAPMRNIEVGRQ